MFDDEGFAKSKLSQFPFKVNVQGSHVKTVVRASAKTSVSAHRPTLDLSAR